MIRRRCTRTHSRVTAVFTYELEYARLPHALPRKEKLHAGQEIDIPIGVESKHL